jgi:RND superfamily putative drug exporter
MAPVGGIPRSVVADRLPSVVAIVVLGTFAALLLGFRSVFVAVKAMALNLLSVGAAIGALGDGYP